MSITVAISNFSDFEALHGVMQDGQSDVVQIGRGQMSGTLTHISAGPSFGVSSGNFSRGVRLSGVPSEHRFMLGMVLATDGEATAWQHEVRTGDFIMIAPGEERYSVYQDATRFSAVFVCPEELQAFLASHPGATEASEALQRMVARSVSAADTAAHIGNLTALTAALSEQGPSLPDGTTEFYKRNILELVTTPMRHAVRYYGRQPRSYAALVRDVDNYITAAGNRPVHVSEICSVFNVGRRALHRAFDSVLGIPPVAFSRRKRLGDVHQALLSAGNHETIKHIAIEHGFADLPRFARAYRRLFGELPSDTLRRGYQIVRIILWALLFCHALPSVMCPVSA